ncbi:hypothetical protein GOBAR_DD23701 [Gossypium barbadense]|nr:hypothetical protein GOBAR_DD23701 [Gossypium barbadense]
MQGPVGSEASTGEPLREFTRRFSQVTLEIKGLIDDWAKSVFIAGPDHQFLKYALAVNMREKLFQLYDMTGKCAEIEDVDNATSSRDYEMVVFGHYLTVQPWIVDFNPSKAFPSVVLTWIRFPGLPGLLYKRKVLEQIGSLVGKVARLHLKPDNRTSGRFIRMVVFMDLDKPLISQVLVNDKFQIIEFEALPAVCFAYGRYGHVKGSCHFEMVELNLPIKEEKTIPLTENVNGGGGSLRPLDDYRTEV